MHKNEIHKCICFITDDILVGKVTKSASLSKIHFPKISEHTHLTTVLQDSTTVNNGRIAIRTPVGNRNVKTRVPLNNHFQ